MSEAYGKTALLLSGGSVMGWYPNPNPNPNPSNSLEVEAWAGII